MRLRWRTVIVDPAEERIAEDLTSRLDRPRYRHIIDADIANPALEAPSHSERLDRRWQAGGRPPVPGRVARAIFLHSLAQIGSTGARPEEMNLAVLTPGQDATFVRQARGELEQICCMMGAIPLPA